MITITGTGFGDGATVTFDGVPATAIVVVNQTKITCTPPDHADGFVEVTVTNPDGTTGTLADAFVYTTLAIDPEEGPIAGGTTLTITISDGGAGIDWFPAGHTFRVHITNAHSSIDFSDPDLYVVLFGGVAGTRISDGELTCLTPDGVCGPTDVIVIDATKVSPDPNVAFYLPGGYIYQLNAPTVTDLLPVSGAARGGTHVVLTGTFSPTTCEGGGTTAVTFGDVPLTSLGCTVDTITGITGLHDAGLVDVVVINPDGQTLTLPAAYTYINAPTVVSIDPEVGPDTGGTAVTITGTGFQDGASVLMRGVDTEGLLLIADAFDVVVDDDTTIAATTSACIAPAPPGHTIQGTVPTADDLPPTDVSGMWLTVDDGHLWTGNATTQTWTDTGYLYQGTVATAAALPPTGNVAGDAWETEDSGYVWRWEPSGTPHWVNTGQVLTDTVPTMADLPQFSEAGDAWLVEDTGHLYLWDVAHWADTGDQYFRPAVVDVVVTNPDGQRGTLEHGYSYEGWWGSLEDWLTYAAAPPREVAGIPGRGWTTEALLPVPVDGWWMSTAAYGGAIMVVASTRPKDPRRWNQIATFATGSAAMLGGSPGIAGVFHNRLVYAASDYTVGTTYPPIRIYDGSFDRELCRLPPTAALAVPQAILSLLVANGTIYLSSFDSGTSSADWSGRVFSLDLNTAVLTPVGGVFPTGHLPYALAWHNGSLWCGTHRQTTGGAAKVLRIRPDQGDTAWTEDATFSIGYNLAALYSWHGTLYAGTTAAAGTFAQILKRATDGTWSTAHTGSGGAAQHNNGFLAFCPFGDALYASYWNADTPAVATIRKTTDGTTWTTCYTGSGSTLRPFIVLTVDNNELFAIGGGAHLTVAILRSPDGATWINLTDELPDPEKTALPAVGALVF